MRFTDEKGYGEPGPTDLCQSFKSLYPPGDDLRENIVITSSK